MRILLAIGVATAAAAAVAVLATSNGSGTPSAPASSPSLTARTFGPNYEGLVARRDAAHVPTMTQTMSSTVHFHPLIKVYVNGTQMTVPANIGIDPRVDGMQMAGLHTHDTSGTIHVEGVPNATLGQFFAIWGVAFTARQLGPDHARAGTSVRMWVNRQPSHAFGALKLANGQQIVVSYGPTTAPAPF